jgi:hypothetical protein
MADELLSRPFSVETLGIARYQQSDQRSYKPEKKAVSRTKID